MCRCSAEVIVQVTVQEVQRMCKVQRWCREGADADAEVQRWCRGAEVVQRCRGVGAEQGCRCRAGAEVQVCRICAEVQSICKGSGEVIVQVIVQRRCRYGGAATDMQRCR